jgi:sigma-B regulation protein RsbU (phosphoserine phosphatase)
MIAAQLNVPAGTLTFCTAGHPEAIYVTADGKLESLTSDGAVMGSFATARYQNATRQILAGDRIVLVTDGFLEAENAAGEELGESRLAQWVAELRAYGAVEMYERLNARLLEFAGDQVSDDATLIVIAAD